MVAFTTDNRRVAIVGGVRTPFARMGTALAEVPMVELARMAMQETLYRSGIGGGRLDEVVLGNVVMPPEAANPARVAAIAAGVPEHIPARTVQRNCASGMESIADAAARIAAGNARLMLVGGAESMSNIPLLFPRDMLGPMARLARAKSAWQRLRALAAFRPRHFRPVVGLTLGLTDPSVDMIMGRTAEVLAHEFDISRDEQDAFALRSHRRATAAVEAGRFAGHMVTVYAGEAFTPVSADVGPRPGQSAEALAKLPTIFDRRDGSVTVGNSCQVTDGAVALLTADGELARAEGLDVLGYVRAYAVAALDPARMGLGPVYAIDRLLAETRLTLADVDLWEINEAFAAQVLACLRAMADDDFARRHLGRHAALGELEGERLNVNGGAIALGHPVGATGARLVLDLLHEMRRRDVRRGVAALCVGGGQGAAILLERS
ncbi:MAG: Acetyl-CoA acetyltransferase [Phycisphaerae bacterium]|nr:Acetyl-CoA acetyltransferase [Phycisphaerae bacterium]